MVILEMSIAGSFAHPGEPLTPQGPVVVRHPNREKPVVQATRATVVLLLLVSAGLVLIVVYLVLAFFAARWNRGVLPVAAALAVLLLVFALVAAPFWFDRDKAGFAEPNLNAGLLGVVTFLIVPVQMLLIAFAMRGFNQGWNVELEQAAGGGPAGPLPTPRSRM
jgi:membrane protease YdiL (CAAX protease family)